jgi:hypothetical protein
LACHLQIDADPEPQRFLSGFDFFFNTDPDPAVHFDADPDPVLHQNEEGICNLWPADDPWLKDEPPWLHCDPPQLPNFYSYADPDQTFDFLWMRIRLFSFMRIQTRLSQNDADYADPDPQH